MYEAWAYPPCASVCPDRVCCSQGYKYEWAELVGKNGEDAKSIIEKDNPLVTVIVTKSPYATTDFCCNRVIVVVDANGIVIDMPYIG